MSLTLATVMLISNIATEIGSKHPFQESSIEIAARSCDIASMDAVQQLALELKQMPRVAGGIKS